MLESSATADWPLVIALEDELIKINPRDEMLLDTLRVNPLSALRQLLGGSTNATASLPHVDHWPVDQVVVDQARSHADAGGHVVLVTCCDRAIAEALQARFPFLTEVIFADAPADKADAVQRRFPEGCSHVGGTRPFSGKERRATSLLSPRSADISVLRRALRLHQWAKNILLFVPLVLGGKAGDMTAWMAGMVGFLAIGCVASATYIINDLWDLPSDRGHWSKFKRPLASGDLPVRTGVLLSGLLMTLGFVMAALVSGGAVLVLAAYVLITLVYSFALKRVPILDVLVLAGLFTWRIGFGIVLTNVRLSPWLLVFAMFTFASLSLAKRHVEVAGLNKHGLTRIQGRGYLAGDAPLIMGLGMSTAMGGVLIMIMYLIEDALPMQFYQRPYLLWALPPLLFLFLGRIWLLCQRDQLSDDPVAFALKDRTCLLIGGLVGVAFLTAVA